MDKQINVNPFPIVVRPRDLVNLYSMSESFSKKVFKQMEAEVNRKDSKLTEKALIRVGKLVYFHSVAVYWFLQHKDLLEDETARARVKKFDIKDYKEIF